MRKKLLTKALAGLMCASMTLSLLPGSTIVTYAAPTTTATVTDAPLDTETVPDGTDDQDDADGGLLTEPEDIEVLSEGQTVKAGDVDVTYEVRNTSGTEEVAIMGIASDFQFEGNEFHIDIPAEVDGKPVTTISNGAFNRVHITEHMPGETQTEREYKYNTLILQPNDGIFVTFPTSLKVIEGGAFKDLTVLRVNGDLEFAPGLVKIGSEAFSGCINLKNSIIIPSTIEIIEEKAFYTVPGSTDSTISITGCDKGVFIGDSAFERCSGFAGLQLKNARYIGDKAFYSCTGFKDSTVDLAKTTYIGEYAFASCSSMLADISLNDNMTAIGQYAFSGCSYITSNSGLHLPKNSSYTKVEDYTFNGCYALSGDMVFPDNIVAIGDFAFSNCYSLGYTVTAEYNSALYRNDITVTDEVNGDIILPDSITSIGKSAFYCVGSNPDMINYHKDFQRRPVGFHLPTAVTSIGSSAFYSTDITGLIEFPETMTTIEAGTFSNCKFLGIPTEAEKAEGHEYGDLVIPDNITAVGASAFAGCSGFEGNLILSNSLTIINAETFSGCSGLTGELVIPANVTNIGAKAFMNCTHLGLNHEGKSDYEKLIKPETGYSYYFGTDLDFSGTKVQYIGESAFTNCKGFEGRLILGDSLLNIGQTAFENCSGLVGDIIIPDSVTIIGKSAFINCSRFNGDLILGANVTSIPDTAFKGCTNLGRYKDVNSMTDSPESEGAGYFIMPDKISSYGSDIFSETEHVIGLEIPRSFKDTKNININTFAGILNPDFKVYMYLDSPMDKRSDVIWPEQEQHDKIVAYLASIDYMEIYYLDDEGEKVFLNIDGEEKGAYIINPGDKKQFFAINYVHETDPKTGAVNSESDKIVARIQKVTWTADTNLSGTVDKDTGIFTAVSNNMNPGYVTLTAEAGDGSEKTATMKVRVIRVADYIYFRNIDKPDTDVSSVEVYAGTDKDMLTHIIKDGTDGTEGTYNTDVDFESPDESLMTISKGEDGKFTIKPIVQGEDNIDAYGKYYYIKAKAADGGVIGSYWGPANSQLAVLYYAPAEISFAKDEAELFIDPETEKQYGVGVNLTALFKYDKTNKNIKWSLTDPVAPDEGEINVIKNDSIKMMDTVSYSNSISALSVGESVVTATSVDNHKASVKVNVYYKPDNLRLYDENGDETRKIIADVGETLDLKPVVEGKAPVCQKVTYTLVNAAAQSALKINDDGTITVTDYAENAILQISSIDGSVRKNFYLVITEPVVLTDDNFKYEVREADGREFASVLGFADDVVIDGPCRVDIPASVTIGGKELPVEMISNGAFSVEKVTEHMPGITNEDKVKAYAALFQTPTPAGVYHMIRFKFPGTLATIEGGAFRDLDAFAYVGDNLKFHDGLVKIGSEAFAGCKRVEGNIIIPSTVKTIGSKAFYGIPSVFNETEGKEYSIIIEGPEEQGVDIDDSAFENCMNYRHLVLKNVNSVGNKAFSGCSGLVTGDIDFSMTQKIGESAFLNCSKMLADIELNDNMTEIGSAAFKNCKFITSMNGLHLPDNDKFTRIEPEVFYDCNLLCGDMSFPEGITYVGDRAFYQCFFLGYDVTEVRINPQNGQPEVTGEYEDGSIMLPETVTYIGADAFNKVGMAYCGLRLLIDYNYKIEMYAVDTSRPKAKFNIPRNLETIGRGAYYATNITGTLYISKSLPTIPAETFFGCIWLGMPTEEETEAGIKYGNLEIPDNITTIGDGAFRFCQSFEGTLKLPADIKAIPNYAFSECYGLSGDLVIPTGVTIIGNYAFNKCMSLGKDRDSDEEPDVIKPDGSGYSYYFGKDLDLSDEDITSIGNFAFAGCESFEGRLLLSPKLSMIGESGFDGCSGLVGDLLLPDSLTTLGKNAFLGCERFNGDLHISNKLTVLNEGVFSTCTNLGRYKNVNSMTRRPSSEGAGYVDVPDSVQTIQKSIFTGDDYIRRIVITRGLKKKENVDTNSLAGLNNPEFKLYIYRNSPIDERAAEIWPNTEKRQKIVRYLPSVNDIRISYTDGDGNEIDLVPIETETAPVIALPGDVLEFHAKAYASQVNEITGEVIEGAASQIAEVQDVVWTIDNNKPGRIEESTGVLSIHNNTYNPGGIWVTATSVDGGGAYTSVFVYVPKLVNARIYEEIDLATQATILENDTISTDRPDVVELNGNVATIKKFAISPKITVKAKNGSVRSIIYLNITTWPFKDMKNTDSGAQEMLQAYNYGIVNGIGPDAEGLVKVKPGSNVTRAQFAIMLYELAKYKGFVDSKKTYTANFSDIKKGDTGYEAVAWANEEKIITGFANGTFKPTNDISRAQISLMLMRFADFCDLDTSKRSEEAKTYPDFATLKAPFDDSCSWAIGSGIVSGKKKQGVAVIAPNDKAVRSQCAMFIIRFMNCYGLAD
ncbi:MAG: leucine-rich repeat protein [Eubacterium sp.]|nr:leucine-rich repeat protein [Eubacterium sp.]